MRDLRYADDTSTELRHLIQAVKERSEEKRLYFNVKKTKILDIDRCSEISNILVDREKIECVQYFDYLGSRFENNGKNTMEIKRRAAIALSQLTKLGKSGKRVHAVNKAS